MITKISIITTVRNGARTIGECITSVKRQTLCAEHIIIDALSSDGTIEIIRRRRSSDSIFVPEADKGFYDAINKGLKLATGDVIGLLNADDVYVHDRVLERAAECFTDLAVDSGYGDPGFVDSMGTCKVLRY
jgi:glycosyltransferase involved in cell wall biosynthesis